MKNLAGDPDCDATIREELERARIDIVEAPMPSGYEVNARLTGKLGAFTFRRAWYYWIVQGEMPLESARWLYEHPGGRKDVRVAGHCEAPPPEYPWLEYRDAEGRKIIQDPDGKQERECRELLERTSSEGLKDALRKTLAEDRFVPDAMAAATRVFVGSYHVDTELGLWLVAEEIRRITRRP